MQERKRQVLLTAQRLFVEKGFAETSVQDILEESNISKGTFYNYFSSKNECLMAILEHTQEVINLKQRELLIGQDPSDKNILAEQIAVHLQMSREHNMIMLFEAIFYLGAKELKEFVRKHYLNGLFWLTKRIIDVYGEYFKPYAFDSALLMSGMLQHLVPVWVSRSHESEDNLKPIHFVMRRMDVLVTEMIQSKDTLLGETIYLDLKTGHENASYTKQELITQLDGFSKKLDTHRPEGKQYIQFLLDELKTDQPRIFLIETVARSLTETFSETADGAEAKEITSKLWGYIDTLKNTESGDT